MGFAYKDIRPFKGGAVSSASAFELIAAGGTEIFVNIAGRGALYLVNLYVNAGAHSELAQSQIELDGNYIYPMNTMSNFNTRGFTSDTLPFQLTAYGGSGICNLLTYFPDGLAFEKSLAISTKNMSGANSITVICDWLYVTL